jgi:hypothetical protein
MEVGLLKLTWYFTKKRLLKFLGGEFDAQELDSNDKSGK